MPFPAIERTFADQVSLVHAVVEADVAVPEFSDRLRGRANAQQ